VTKEGRRSKEGWLRRTLIRSLSDRLCFLLQQIPRPWTRMSRSTRHSRRPSSPSRSTSPAESERRRPHRPPYNRLGPRRRQARHGRTRQRRARGDGCCLSGGGLFGGGLAGAGSNTGVFGEGTGGISVVGGGGGVGGEGVGRQGDVLDVAATVEDGYWGFTADREATEGFRSSSTHVGPRAKRDREIMRMRRKHT
jgi:hypothetical protein